MFARRGIRLACVCMCWAALALSRLDAQNLTLGLNIDGRQPGFEAEVNGCFTELTRLGEVSSRLVANIRGAPYFIVITPGRGPRNETRVRTASDGTLAGVVIFWNPANRAPYADG